jgi:hypothetical protein
MEAFWIASWRVGQDENSNKSNNMCHPSETILIILVSSSIAFIGILAGKEQA